MVRIRSVLLVFPVLFLIAPIAVEAVSPILLPPAALVDAASIVKVEESTANVAAAATCTSPYTVKAGDTLIEIAEICNVDYSTLLAANGNITNPNLIFPGQTVVIPQGSIPNTGGQTYTVVAGDRLFRIALRYNTTVQAILNANPWITNPNLIYPGNVITLPAGSGTGIPTTGGQTYTVVSGDTLSGIAQRFNTTTAALLNANTWITNPDLIYPGWVIAIP